MLARRAGLWLVCADCLLLWVDGLLGHVSVACGIIIIGYRYLVVGGVWLTQSVWGALVHCWVSGMAHGVVPGLAAGDCHGVWWLRVVWVCCVRTG